MQDQQLFGLLLIPVSLTGVICNWTIFFTASRIKSLNPSFAILVATMAAADGCASVLFAFYVTPMIVLDLKVWKFYSHHCGFLLMIAYDISINTHLLIVFNRFSAVFTPIAYKTVFSARSTKFLVFVAVSISLTTLGIFFLIIGCQLIYNDDIWMFYYSDKAICWWFSEVLDNRKMFSTAALGVLVNTSILLKVRATRKKINHGHTSTARKQKEMDFLKQTVGQGLFLFFFATIYSFVAVLVENQILGFLLTTLLWCCLHTIDGLFVITFNSEIRGAVGFRRE